MRRSNESELLPGFLTTKGTKIISPGVAVNPADTASIRAFATLPTEMFGLSKFEATGSDCVRRVPRPREFEVASAFGTAFKVTVMSRESRPPRSPRLQIAVLDARSYAIGLGLALTSSKFGLKTKSARELRAAEQPVF